MLVGYKTGCECERWHVFEQPAGLIPGAHMTA
jgi:hypothetical protein